LDAGHVTPSVPAVIEAFIKALVVTNKAVSLYPSSSDMPLDTAKTAAGTLGKAFSDFSDIRLLVTKDGLFYDGVPLYPDKPTYVAFARELHGRRLSEVRFHAGVNEHDIVSFLQILKYTAEEIESSGGYEARLWDVGVTSITVTEVHVSLVEGQDDELAETARAVAMSREEVDEALSSAYGGRSRDSLTIVRFMSDSSAVSSYLNELSFGTGGMDTSLVAERFAELAELAFHADGDERHALTSSLAEALKQLDPDIRRSLLINQVLAEARTSEPLAAVIRQLDIDSVCRMLVDGISEDDVQSEALARAIRNLSMISMAGRDEVVMAAGAAMTGSGLSQKAVSAVLETAAPSRLSVVNLGQTTASSAHSDEAIFQLLDIAPGVRSMPQDDSGELTRLREEARRGITDGDIIMALVTLVGLDARESQFASTMTMLEDSLDLLIERGELDIAADATDALTAAAENPLFSPEQRLRLQKAMSRFSRPEDIRAYSKAMRLYKPGTVEHEAARRLLYALGPTAIAALMEQLSDEPDMTVRKSIVDVLSRMAGEYISELGAYVSDHRWYVVRNVVAVLGATRSSAILTYLGRTIRHPEPRVRRETIRALSCIHDRLSHEMLMACLEDDDAQNVRLAARYLGTSGVTEATGLLIQVAKGEGRGNRDAGPRVDAIEALGRLGATEALPVLQAIIGRRGLGALRSRELRSVAESAVARIEAHREVTE
jgi:HEAT repeat protein